MAGTLGQFLCGIRGHRWQTEEQAGANITVCERCGKLQHSGGKGSTPGQFFPPEGQ